MRLSCFNIALLAVEIVKTVNALNSLETEFTGTTLDDGDIWSITTKDYGINVEQLAVHMAENTVQVTVYYRPGEADLVGHDSYEQVFQEMITGEGMGTPTLLPSFETPIEIPPNSTYTIYSSCRGVTDPHSFYHTTGSLAVNSAFTGDETIDISEGYSAEFPFYDPVSPTRWNGVVYYSILEPSSLPSQAPSISLTPSRQPSMLPSLQPSGSPSVSAAPSSEPSLAPSVSFGPTREPSLSPSSSAQPSSEPSLVPSKSAQPSSEPSVSPSRSALPSSEPSLTPSKSAQPSVSLYPTESTAPSKTSAPSESSYPSMSSVPSVSFDPTMSIAPSRSGSPSGEPSAIHSTEPSAVPSAKPSVSTIAPSGSEVVSEEPSLKPSLLLVLSDEPSSEPTIAPSKSPKSSAPSGESPLQYKSTTLEPIAAPATVAPSATPTLTSMEEKTFSPSMIPSPTILQPSGLTSLPSQITFATSAPSDIDKTHAPSTSPSTSLLPSNSVSEDPSQSTSHPTASSPPTLTPTSATWGPSTLSDRLLPRHNGPPSSSSERRLDGINVIIAFGYICVVMNYLVL